MYTSKNHDQIRRAVEYTDTLLAVSKLRMERSGITVVFVLFGDESGNHTNERSPFLSIGAYCAPTTTWGTFKNHWAETLDSFGLSSFHMTEYLSRKDKPYCEWSDKRYDDCISQLIDVINTYNLRGFAIQVSRDEYNSLLSPAVKKKLTQDPHILVFDTVVTHVLRWMGTFPRSEQVTMYFHNTSFAARVKKRYEKRRQNDPSGHRLAEDLFFVSDSFLPIQAADILASLARNFERGKVIRGALPITPRVEQCLMRLNRTTKTSWRTITANDLKKTDAKLRRILDN